MTGSSLKFGTSGLRGLSVELQGDAARRYTAAFIAHLRAQDNLGSGRVYLARDLRPSSAGIAADCAAAIAAAGLVPIDCGVLPTPALALHAMAGNGAAIMVTGSHIPSDRNGLKFYTPRGEITKDDEAGIAGALAAAEAARGDVVAANEHDAAAARYAQRYASLTTPELLAGWRVGVFEHSSVAREVLAQLLSGAGAEVLLLGRVNDFVAVDTEAFGDAVFAPLSAWVAEHRLDAIVSADGDGDRPLLMDGQGNFVRGDVLGLLAAQFLGADVVITPVTSNSAIERTGYFPKVERTRVGSPFVIAGMEQAVAAGGLRVVGFEANGGTLLGNDVTLNAVDLPALPTRDAVLPLLAALAISARAGQTVAQTVAALPVRAALANRLEHVPQERTATFLTALQNSADAEKFFAPIGMVGSLSALDGLQFTMANGDIVHYRASGNAPELRCYVEAATLADAQALLDWGLAAAAQAVR
ncbi:phosphomannomutase [Devosia sp.]|uniref:phosphomannomutase n=1 Tax=Devosia sp. TaxID=1871048 RepID=UPI0032636F46